MLMMPWVLAGMNHQTDMRTGSLFTNLMMKSDWFKPGVGEARIAIKFRCQTCQA